MYGISIQIFATVHLTLLNREQLRFITIILIYHYPFDVGYVNVNANVY